MAFTTKTSISHISSSTIGGNNSANHNDNDIENMNLKKELRPLARRLITELANAGEITRSQASQMRDTTKRASKDKVVDLVKSLRDQVQGAQGSQGQGQGQGQGNEPSQEPSQEPNNEPTEPTSSNNEPQIPKSEIEKMISEALMSQKQPTKVPTKSTSSGKLEHWQMPLLKTILDTNRQALLVGGAGSGKTTIGRQVAEYLGFGDDKYYAISLSGGISEAHLTGRMNIQGDFISTKFLEIVEGGGVVLLDEFDNAEPDVLVSLNNLLAGEETSAPMRTGKEVVKRHKDCYFIATANTWGNGSGGSSGYVRKQQDQATLDRFVCSKMYLGTDRRIVNYVLGLKDERPRYPKAFDTFEATSDSVESNVKLLRGIFDFILEAINDKRRNVRQLLGTRAYKQGSKLIREANMSPLSILEMYLSNWTDDQLKTINVTRERQAKLDYFNYDFSDLIDEVSKKVGRNG